MRKINPLVACAALSFVSACVSTPTDPARAVDDPPPAIAIKLPANLEERNRNWRAQPLTEGEWAYAADAQTSSATFAKVDGPARFRIICDISSQLVTLERVGMTAAEGDFMKVRTEILQRDLPTATPDRRVLQTFAYLDRGDPLLDALARSEERFAIQLSFIQLYLPASPDVARVVSDCR
ncbi:MAG: hypothetical protein COW16_10210 [Sphingomonadales bacterium CG12_big_fil_rev_8_21_14_0_65_65_10]|nr:MAG: hypothetical protein COW16_10210 [Sphingomonadales bacterium CG12_big_fil_rev_8_21_14_0_65_65_10]